MGGGGVVLFCTLDVGVTGMGNSVPDETTFWELDDGDMIGEREGAGEGELKGDTELTDSEDGLLRGVESKFSTFETELCVGLSGPLGPGALASKWCGWGVGLRCSPLLP